VQRRTLLLCGSLRKTGLEMKDADSIHTLLLSQEGQEVDQLDVRLLQCTDTCPFDE